jgi:hypothetical protein
MRWHHEPRTPVPAGRSARRVPRRGAALLEFALIALVLYLLLAVTIEMGRSLYSSQLLQQAADTMAREISRTPLPATITLEEALYDTRYNARVLRDIYSEDFLVIDLDRQLLPGQTLADFFADKPIVNRLLSSLMIFQDAGGRRLVHYPGALFASRTAPSGLTVYVPVVVGRDRTGAETVDWVRVVEEVRPTRPPITPPPPPSTFPIQAPERGLVSVRLNFPFQAATLSAFRASPRGPFEPGGAPIQADDGKVRTVDQNGFTPPGSPLDPGQVAGPYAGPNSLGRQLALGQALRPYRKLLTAQAVYRREVFGPVVPSVP